MTMRLDRALLRPAGARGRGAAPPTASPTAVVSRRALGPSVFSTTWAYIDHVVVPPGASTPEQAHDAVGEAYYVLAGAGTVTIKGATPETAAVRTGDAIPIRIGESSRFANTGSEPLELFVMGVARDMAAKTRLLSGNLRTENDVHRRGIMKSALMAAAAALGVGRFARPAERARRSTSGSTWRWTWRPAREREMLDTFHNVFVPEAVKHAGYIRVKMLKRRTILQGTAPAPHNYRFELEFENEDLRQKWIASAGHQRVWPQVERCMTTLKDYPVVLYDEV